MNNKEQILKYLSGLMDDSEIREFEKNLETLPELKSEFEKIENNLNHFNLLGDVEVKEQYFNNLIPKVRERINSKTSSPFPKLTYAVSLISVLVILFLLNTPVLKNNYNNFWTMSNMEDSLLTIIGESDSTDLANVLDDNFLENYSFYENGDYRDNISELTYQNLLDETISSNYDYIFNEQTTEDIISNLSDEEIESLYNSLLEKKIL